MDRPGLTHASGRPDIGPGDDPGRGRLPDVRHAPDVADCRSGNQRTSVRMIANALRLRSAKL